MMKKLFSKFLLFVLLLAIFLPFGQVVSSETIASTASSAPQSTELSTPSVPETTSIETPQSTVVQQTQTTSSAAVKQESQQSSPPEIQPKKEQPAVNTTQSSSPPVQSKEKSEQQVARLQLVKEPTPSISIDFVNEQLIGFDSTGNYQVNYGARIETVSGQTAFPITDDMMSKVWRIKKMGNGITTEDSDQQQLTIPGRAKLPEDWIQAFDETVQGKNDGKLQGVNQEYEYRLNGGAWTKGTPGGLVENLAPGTYEIRIANGRQFVSSPIVKTIKAALPKHAAPNITIDYEEELLQGFDQNGTYDVYFDSTNSKTITGQTEMKISEDMFGKGWRIVRKGDGLSIQDSDSQQLTVNHRRILYDSHIKAIPESAHGDNDGQLEGVDPEMEYRLAGASTWTNGPPNRIVKGLAPGDYDVRYEGSNSSKKFASVIVKKTIQAGLPREATPSITIDYEAEKLTGFDAANTYEITFGTDERTIMGQTNFAITEDMFGKSWKIVKFGDWSNTQNSKAQSLTIPGRQSLYPEMVTAIDESAQGENDGKLQGVRLDREYREVGDQNWMKGTNSGTVENLSPGDYEIRYYGSNQNKKFASAPVKKTIQAGLPREATPSITIDYEAEKLAGFDAASTYEITFGSDKRTITGQTSFTIAEDMFGKGWKIVKVGDGINTQNSQVQSLTIPGRQSLYPEMVTAIDESAQGENDGKLQGVRLDREYREVGDQNWMKGTNSGTVENLSPGDYEIRYYGSNQNKKFASVPVKKTIQAGLPREVLPTIVIDYEKELLTGFLATAKYEISYASTIISVENKTEIPITEAMMNGNTWQIIQKASDATKLDSKPQSLAIPKRQILSADAVKAIDESVIGKSDGQLQGVLPTMAYRSVKSSDWTVGVQDGVIRNLAPGDYEIRERANNQQQNFSSTALIKTIKQGSLEPEQHYVVTFDSNGGSKVDSQKVEKGERLKEPQKPTRKGYTFGGWFSDQELRQVWDFAEPISSDITLYAKWVLEQKETSTTKSTSITTEVTTTLSAAAGKPAGSTTKKTEQQKAAQNQTAKQYPKANDQASNSYWVGMGLVLLGAAGFLLRRTRKFSKS